MNKNETFNDNKINKMLLILKNIIMIFDCLVIYQLLPYYWTNLNEKNGDINQKAIILVAGIFILIYAIWIMINFYLIRKKSYKKILSIMEIFFYVIIIALPIYLFNAYDSEFKYIFLLVIIVAIIQYGLRYGVASALTSAIVVLGADLFYAPIRDGINANFEKDLILVGVFILVAWILGYYVELENENKKEKDRQLKKLNSDLKKESMERSNIEELLLKNSICFDMLFENSQNAIIVHKGNKIIYANESAAKLFGYEDAVQLAKMKLMNYYAEDKTKTQKEKYSRIMNSKLSKVTEEETILNSKGKSITVRNTSSFFIYEGQPSVLTFMLDITMEKQLELLKSDAEKNLKLLNETREFNILITDFFTNISHEIKTPLNIIYAAIQSLEMYFSKDDNENVGKYKEYLKTMKQNSFRMIRLVNNLIDVTRFDSGFMKLNSQNHNIVSVVEDITQSVAVYAKNKNIKVVFDTNVEEKNICFDDDKIERIILNLLSNAFKYTPENGEIKVNLEDREANIIISVKDNGEGISKEKQGIIFERFGQANRSLSRKYEGSGIGLYLVKSFVEMHHGTITVNSVEGEGTEFIITLPADVEKHENQKKGLLVETNIERVNIEFSDIYNIN